MLFRFHITLVLLYLFLINKIILQTNINDPEIFRQAKTILLEMGHFFQVQVQIKLTNYNII